MPAKKKTTKQIPGGARKRKGGFPCPDCDFVAKHAMGLGRHRSTRHGVVSKRQQRMASSGAWLTREQAAERANVHYNTIRQWERSGELRKTTRAGVRGSLVNAVDLNRLLAERGKPPAVPTAGVDAAAVAQLEARFSQLVAGLETLLASLKEPPKRRGRPPGSKNKPKAASKPTKRKPAKSKAAKRKPAKRKPAKRKTSSRSGSAKRRR